MNRFPKHRKLALSLCLTLLTLNSDRCGLLAEDITVNPVFLNLIEQAQVPALEEGPVMEILVKEGEHVEFGRPLVKIDDQRAQYQKLQADHDAKVATKKAADRSEIELAETEFKLSGASLQRALESRKKFPDTPSQAEVDELQLRVAQARQHIEKATNESQLAQWASDFADTSLMVAQYELERHKIKSPIQGTVVEILARRGEWVRPGQPVARVIRMDRLRVEGWLPREKIRAGMETCAVTVVQDDLNGKQQKLSGKIVFVNPEVDPNDGRQRVLADVDNSQGLLGPGMRAVMVIHAR